jgi:predicted  nucleic acid-binding Zn-ribbon protein
MPDMSEDDEGIRNKVQSRGEKAAADLAQALISSPAFGQAVSAAVLAREKAGDAQRAAMGALNVSSQDESERLERRLRVLSERLEESEDRLDRALAQVRDLSAEIETLKSVPKKPARKPAESKPGKAAPKGKGGTPGKG